MRAWIQLVCLVGLWAWAGPSEAQDYPNRPIKFVVPFPAGGPADTISRILTEKMAGLIGQSIVIENRAGAGGLTGIAAVAKAEPDGYTLAIAPSSGLAMNVNLRETMPFHPLKDLALITQIVSVPEILVVNEKVPVTSLAELVSLAKSQPGKMVFASTGLGGMPHMAMELFKLTAQIDLVHVPYTGAAPAVNDLLGGHVQMMVGDVPALLGGSQSWQLRAGAVRYCSGASSRGSCGRWRLAAKHALPACRRSPPRPSSACHKWKRITGTAWWRRLRRLRRSSAKSTPRPRRRCSPTRSRTSLPRKVPLPSAIRRRNSPTTSGARSSAGVA